MLDASHFYMFGMNACMIQCANTSVPAELAWQAEPADEAPVVHLAQFDAQMDTACMPGQCKAARQLY